MLEQLFNSVLLYSLSLTLVHFLWQGLLVGLALKLALFLIDDNKSKTRYALATLAMFSNILLAILTFSTIYPETNNAFNTQSNSPSIATLNSITQQSTLVDYQQYITSFITYLLPYLSIAWFITVLVLATKLLVQIRNVNQLPIKDCVPVPSALLRRFELLAKQINLTTTPTLLISLKTKVPMAIGWLKPVVLLPASMVSGLTSAQLEMLILHELAHIRRHDYLVNFFQSAVELVFFFHPCVHWIGKQMRHEREYCSDDIAVKHCGDAIAYAHTLTDTASLCANGHIHTIPTMAMAASGGDLKTRVLRLVDHHCAPTNYTSKSFAAVFLLLALPILSISHVLLMPFTQQVINQPTEPDNSLKPKETSIVNNAVYTDNLQVRKPEFIADDNSFNFSYYQAELAENLVLLPQVTSVTDTPLLSSLQFPSTVNQPTDESNLVAVTEPFKEQSNIASSQKDNSEIIVDSRVVNKKANLAVDESVFLAAIADNTKSESIAVETSLDAITHEASTFVAINTAVISTAKNIIENSSNEQNFSKSSQDTLLEIASQEPEKISPKLELIPAITEELDLAQPEIVSIAPIRNLSHQYIVATDLADTDLLSSVSEIESQSHNLHSETKLQSVANRKNIIPFRAIKPKLLTTITPIYPDLAKRRRIEMEVEVNFTIDEDGRVKDVNFNEQNKVGYFKSSVLSAVSKWRFSPATKDNQIVESKMSKIFSFSLDA